MNSAGRTKRESALHTTFYFIVKRNWRFLYFLSSILVFVFLCGIAVGTYEMFPYPVLNGAIDAAKDWKDNWRHNARLRPDKMITPARHSGEGVTTYTPSEVYDGISFITGIWQGVHGMNLVKMDGSLIHQWRVSFSEIWPDMQHLDIGLHEWDTLVHGAILYPNGDVIFNFENAGTVKIDKCSNILWKLPYATHHSIYEDENGHLWIPGRKRADDIKSRPKIGSLVEDVVLEVSPQGEILREMSILDIIFKSGYEGVLFANGRSNVHHEGGDMTHLNDIKILNKSMDDAFPLFDAGDIMISLRNLNMLMIVEPETGEIKWTMIGPYLRQHDPEFLENGRISVFDNRRDDANGSVFGGSQVLEVDPVTQDVTVAYEGGEENVFYTNRMGEHQRLPNGNILITESLVGRAFEVTAAGEVVWSYINRWDDDEVAWIAGATRYPSHYAAFAEGAASCRGESPEGGS